MHRVQPNQKVKIIPLQIAVPADLDDTKIASGISALLTEGGVARQLGEGVILDWQYGAGELHYTEVQASKNALEGEVFGKPVRSGTFNVVVTVKAKPIEKNELRSRSIVGESVVMAIRDAVTNQEANGFVHPLHELYALDVKNVELT